MGRKDTAYYIKIKSAGFLQRSLAVFYRDDRVPTLSSYSPLTELELCHPSPEVYYFSELNVV
ncbi:MAG: hypothetical protein WCG93_14295 [Paludibacter sp.]